MTAIFAPALDKYTRALLARIATDYSLDESELIAKYVDTATVVPVKKARVPKGDRTPCPQLTGKKTQCKNMCLPGGTACHFHSRSGAPKPIICQPCEPEVAKEPESEPESEPEPEPEIKSEPEPEIKSEPESEPEVKEKKKPRKPKVESEVKEKKPRKSKVESEVKEKKPRKKAAAMEPVPVKTVKKSSWADEMESDAEQQSLQDRLRNILVQEDLDDFE